MDYPATTATADTLPNGLTLLLDPDGSAPVVSVQIWVASGSMHEDEHLGSGLSHFLEHMVFKGTRDHDGETLADLVQAAGGHWNAYTSFDRTVYFIDGPAESLDTFLHCLSGLVFFPTLPESEFEREKDVIRREIDMGLDDPDHVSTQQLFHHAFQLDPRRHPVIGHRHLFDRLSHEDLRSYHRRRYTPDRCFLVISGDFDPAVARELVERHSEGVLPGCGREPLVSADPPQLGPRHARRTFAIPVSRLALAWKCPPLDHPDAAAFEVLAAVLGRGRASRLHRKLREEASLALEISAFCWTGSGREGLVAVSADAEPAKRDALVQAILAEISALAAGPLDEDLAKAKRQIAASQFRSLTSASGRASDLASNWHEARDLDFTRRFIAAVDAVTAADLRRAAARLDPARMTYTLVDPPDASPPARPIRSRGAAGGTLTHTLANGLRLALLPDRRVPLVHLQAAVRAGLPSETPATNGLNQLLAATLTKGTTRRTAHDIASALESLGASIGAATGNNALLVQAGGLAEDLPAILEIFAEVIQSPAFPSEAIGRERASQSAALEEALQDPLHRAFRHLREAHYQGLGYGLDPLGSPASLAELNRLSLAAHHALHFNAANLCLAVAGDFDPAELLPQLEAAFADLPAGEPWQPPASEPRPGADLRVHLPKKQAVLVAGFPGGGVSSAERHALAMLQEYAADMAGPLFTRIREELGLAYQVGATQFLGYDSGLFTAYLATSPDQLDLARAELLSELAKIAADGIPDEAFERVRATVLSGHAIQLQSPASCARHTALDLIFGHPADENRRLAERYRALDAAGVREVARRVFSQEPTLVTILPDEAGA